MAMLTSGYNSRTLRIVQVWHTNLTFDILGLAYKDRILTFFLNVSSRPGHAEVGRTLRSQFWQLQTNRYEPHWHVCFARATDQFSHCNLHCSDASALWSKCRMKLYHRYRNCSSSLAYWHFSYVPHVYASTHSHCLRFLTTNGLGSARKTVESLQGSQIINKSYRPIKSDRAGNLLFVGRIFEFEIVT